MSEALSISEILENIHSKADTAVNWAASQTVLPYGFIAVSFALDGTKRIKIGDGKHIWNELDFFSGGNGGGEEKFYLLKFDDECTANSGGWVNNIVCYKQTDNSTFYDFETVGLHKQYESSISRDNTEFLGTAIDLTPFNTLHIMFQKVNLASSWNWFGVMLSSENKLASTVGKPYPDKHFYLRAECAQMSILNEQTYGGVSEDNLIHTWDIDISSHNGKQFIGFFGSCGEIRVYKLWLQA